MNQHLVVDVLAWASRAEIGETVVYYRNWIGEWEDGEAHRARGSAMLAHLEGRVFLAQRRIRTGAFRGGLQYEATRIGSRVNAMLNVIQVMGKPEEQDSLSYIRVAPRQPRFLRCVA